MLRDTYLSQVSRLDEDLKELEEVVAAYSDQQLAVKHDPQVWSPAQLIRHMRLSEELSLLYVKKKISFDPSLSRAGFLSGVRAFLIQLFLELPFKIKAPAEVSKEKLAGEILSRVELETWHAQRKDLAEFLTELDEKWLDRSVYRHPVFGRISLGQMLDFFQAHQKRHLRQLKSRLPKSPV